MILDTAPVTVYFLMYFSMRLTVTLISKFRLETKLNPVRFG